MERRWLGSADKSGPVWTGRIRGDLRSVCKIFRWADVWRGQERAAAPTAVSRQSKTLSSKSDVFGQRSRSPPEDVASLCTESRSEKKSATEAKQTQTKFRCSVPVQPFLANSLKSHSACCTEPRWRPSAAVGPFAIFLPPTLCIARSWKTAALWRTGAFVLLTNGVAQIRNTSHSSNSVKV